MKKLFVNFPVIIVSLGFFIIFTCQAADNSELEGSWTDPQQGWALEFSGNQTTIKTPSPEVWIQGLFESNPDANPKTIDILIKKSGTPAYEGLTSLGIYKIENNTLTLALGEPGKGARPDTFGSGSGAMVIVVVKEK